MKAYDYKTIEPSEEAPGVRMRTVIGAEQGAPRFAMRVLDVEPQASTPFHSHWWEHEVYVLSGRGVVRTEGGETGIQGGSVVFVEPNERHCFSNVGDEALRFVCVIPLAEKGPD